MQITRNLAKLSARSLVESMDVREMKHLAKRMIPDYDIYKQSGFPESFAIPSIDAAKQIIKDIVDLNLFFQLIQNLIHMSQEGFMGKKIRISYYSMSYNLVAWSMNSSPLRWPTSCWKIWASKPQALIFIFLPAWF